MTRSVCIILATFATLLLSPTAWGEESVWALTPQSPADLQRIQSQVQRNLPAAKRVTVAIWGDGSGSGVIVSPDGLVLTAGHVCGEKGSDLTVILSDGRHVLAKSLGLIKVADAGLLQLAPGRYPYAPLAPADVPVSLGTWCFALGHPGGLDLVRGPVVRLGRVISRNKYTLRSDCKLVGGDSGGPLFDLQGRVIAIHSRISKGADQNFHVPVPTFLVHWPEVIPGRVAMLPATPPRNRPSTSN